MGFPNDTRAKSPPAKAGDQVQALGWEDPMEEGMATLSSNLGLDNPMDRGAWRPSVHRVSKSQIRLKHAGTQFNSIRILKCVPIILLLRIYSIKVLLHVQKTSMFLMTLFAIVKS